jgi:hypothetical protein
MEADGVELPSMMIPIFEALAAPPARSFTITPEMTDEDIDRLLFDDE